MAFCGNNTTNMSSTLPPTIMEADDQILEDEGFPFGDPPLAQIGCLGMGGGVPKDSFR